MSFCLTCKFLVQEFSKEKVWTSKKNGGGDTFVLKGGFCCQVAEIIVGYGYMLSRYILCR